jgi:hypothetical protein
MRARGATVRTSLRAQIPPSENNAKPAGTCAVAFNSGSFCSAVVPRTRLLVSTNVPRIVDAPNVFYARTGRSFMGGRPARDVSGLEWRAHRRPTSRPDPASATAARKQHPAFATALEPSYRPISAPAVHKYKRSPSLPARTACYSTTAATSSTYFGDSASQSSTFKPAGGAIDNIEFSPSAFASYGAGGAHTLIHGTWQAFSARARGSCSSVSVASALPFEW